MVATTVLLALPLLCLAVPLPGSDLLFSTWDAVKGSVVLEDAVTLTYNTGKRWVHPERPAVVYQLADQVVASEDSETATADWREGTADQWTDDHAAAVGLQAQPGMFGLSDEYKSAVSLLQAVPPQGFVTRRWTRGYLLASADGSQALAAPDLEAAAAGLPSACTTEADINMFATFAAKYGTHWVSAVRSGGEATMSGTGPADVLRGALPPEINAEITDAWNYFTQCDAFDRPFHGGQKIATDHFESEFTLQGGKYQAQFASLSAWNSTIPDSPMTLSFKLSPIAELLPSVNARCLEAGYRMYLAKNILPVQETTSLLIAKGWANVSLAFAKSRAAQGFAIGFAGTCQRYCDADGPQPLSLQGNGMSFFGFYEKKSPEEVTVKGAVGQEKKTVAVTCPQGTLLAGITATWAGTCSFMCEQDGPVYKKVDLLCRTPNSADGAFLLSEPDPAKKPTIAEVGITSSSDSTKSCTCPKGYIAETVTVGFAGTCKNKCDADGPVLNHFYMRCRALSDFRF